MFSRNTPSVTLVLVALILGAFGCGGGGGSSSPPPAPPTVSQNKNVLISWSANNEIKVNTTGGGYRVYVSATANFNIGDAGVAVVNMPYVSGAAAPTSTTVLLASGTYYTKVLAYSVFPAGQNNTSALSSEISVSVPFTF